MFRTPQKPWLWTEKLKGTSSAIFGVGTAAKWCELKRCDDRVRSRTDNKDEVLEGMQSRNLNFSPSTKKTTEYSFELFLSINKIVFDFCCLCSNAGHHTISRQKQHRVISSVCHLILVTQWCGLADRRTDGRTDGRTFQMCFESTVSCECFRSLKESLWLLYLVFKSFSVIPM